jgi:DNA processing protein
MSTRLARDLASRDITVVSGMARGIDTAAHKGALEAGGRTIAVLGCGLDLTYPPENRRLRERIVASGAVISEYPPGTEPLARNFPARNRIVSGLSLGVVAVEAAKDSGVFSTVRWALEQGREVFAVPGDAHRPTSAGTNALIRQGAKLTMTVEDILEELPPREASGGPDLQAESTELSDMVRTVYQAVSYEPRHVDAIAEEVGLSPASVASILVGLELKGLVRQAAGKRFLKDPASPFTHR